MKKATQLLIWSICLTFFSFQTFAQDFPWKKSEVISTQQLVDKIKNTNRNSYVILNVGPVDDILYAKNIGAVADPKVLPKLKTKLRKMDKNKEVIFYCGCCAMSNCPNIVPTYMTLKEMGFKKIKVLDIDESIYDDWISKGYPMPKK